MGKQVRRLVDIRCEGCRRSFQLGDTIYLLHMWVIGRDYCIECRDKIISFLDKLSLEVSEEQIPATQASTQALHHEKAYQ